MNNYEKYVANIRQQKSEKIFKLVKKKKGTWLNQTADVHAHFRCELSCKKNHVFYCLPITLERGGWCPICSKKGFQGEELTRLVLERFMGVKFPKTRRIEGLVSDKGNQLEIDGFNEELKIGFEYQGPHHYQERSYSKQKNERFDIVQRKDKIKKEYFRKKGWTLLIVKGKRNPAPHMMVDVIRKLLIQNNVVIINPQINVNIQAFKFQNPNCRKYYFRKERETYKSDKITLELAIAYAKKYTTRVELINSKDGDKILNWAYYHKKEKEVLGHLKTRVLEDLTLSFSEVKKISKKYENKSLLRLHERHLYEYALEKNYLARIFKGKPKPMGDRWTKERLFKVAKGMKTRQELQANYSGAYKFAIRKGFIEELFPKKVKEKV